MTIVRKEPQLVDMDRIHPNEWNPNEQSEGTFNLLAEEIQEDGFDQPINLVSCDCDLLDGDHFQIIGGEHRWRICKLYGTEDGKIPAIIHEDWDETEQKLKTVRRNLLTGDLNPVKFTKLVRELEGTVDRNTMPQLMGFADDKAFSKYVVEDKSETDRTFIDSLVAESKTEKFAVDSITDIVGSIFASCADTVDQNYLFFTHKGKVHMAVALDGAQFKVVETLHQYLRDTGKLAPDVLEAALAAYWKSE
jgi:hypothetical protein